MIGKVDLCLEAHLAWEVERGRRQGHVPGLQSWAGSALPRASDCLNPPAGLPQLSPTK